MDKIGIEYDLDLEKFFAKAQKVSDTLGTIDDSVTAMRRIDPFTQANTSASALNKNLAAQVVAYQRVEAVTFSLRKEQQRVEAQFKDLKSRQAEFLAAGKYAEYKNQLSLIKDKLVDMKSPLVEVNSFWDKLKAKFASGLKVPKIDIPRLPDTPETPPSTGKGKKSKGKKNNLAGEVGEAVVDELAGGIGLSSLSAAGAVAAVGAVVVKSTKEWAEYGKKLSEVSAITGATGKALAFLDDQAQQIEADTGIAGTVILDAFKNIGSIKPELLENNEALAQTTKEVIALAQASGLELPEAARSLLGSLNQFNEAGDQAGRFANVLAAGAKLGASEINETADALQNSGTAMKAAGLSFEQGNALIQSLAGVMIKGSEAGTGLRNVLLKLETSSDKNLRPSVVGLDAALEAAQKKFRTTTELTKIFGVENIVAARRILDTRTEISQMTKDITGTSIAYEQAKTNTDNLATELTKAGTGINTFFRNLGQSQDGFLRGTLQRFNTFLNSLNSKNGTLKSFFSTFSDNLGAGVSTAFAQGVYAYQVQKNANNIAAERKAEVDKITKESVASVQNQTNETAEALRAKGQTEPKAIREAARQVKAARDEEYNQLRADHNRIRKEYEQSSKNEEATFKKRFADSRKRILAAQVAKKQADSAVTRLAKADADQAAALKSALSEPPNDGKKKADDKEKKQRDEINRLLLDAQQDYLKEFQRLETEFGKDRLEALTKDGEAYINAKAEIEKRALQIERDAFERSLQLAASNKTEVVNGKRQVVANTSITLDKAAPDIAKAFNDRQDQIENERARQVKLSRVREEYELLQLAKGGYENELALFDKYWEERILKEKVNAATMQALLAKRDRDRNTLVVDQMLKQAKDQEQISLAFIDTDTYKKSALVDDPSLNAETLERKREQDRLRVRISAGQKTLIFLKEQGEAENAVLITQTQAGLDALKEELDNFDVTHPKNKSIFDLIGLTDGMNSLELAAFREGLSQIGQAIQTVTQQIVEQSEQRIQALDAEIQAKEDQIKTEEERSKEGYANSLSLRRAELQDLKRQKAEEEATRRKALAVQQVLDLATMASNNAVSLSNTYTALTNITKGFTTIPIAGVFLAIGGIATILATLLAAKGKIKALSQLRDGGRLRGPKHEQGGIKGTGAFDDIEVEGGEHIINAKSSDKYDEALEALNKDNPKLAIQHLVKQFGFGLPDLIIKQIQAPNFNQPAPQGIDLSSLTTHMANMNERLLAIEQNTKPGKQITGLGDGRVLEREGNRETVRVIKS